MKIGWLTDNAAYIGGAELTQQEFRAVAPEDVEIIDCPAGGVEPGLDVYVANNIVTYTPDDLVRTGTGRVAWYHHDLSPWIRLDVRRELDARAEHIFCSPLQRDRYGLDGLCIPPAVDLDRYRPTRQARRHRKGAVSIAQWRGPGKGPDAIDRWAADNGPIDVYGEGEFVPCGPNVTRHGTIAPEQVASTLLRYETFVFLPRDVEPFCRSVAEAWASGCKLVVNRNIGAAHWISEAPAKLETAAEDFWEAVL